VQSNFGYGDLHIVIPIMHPIIPTGTQTDGTIAKSYYELTTKKTKKLLPYSAAKRIPTTKIPLTYCI